MLTVKTKTDLEKLKEATEKSHRVEGKYRDFRWRLVLSYRTKEGKLSEVGDCAARFNQNTQQTEKTCIVAFWSSLYDLQVYEQKLDQNRTFIANNLMRLDRELPDVLRSASTPRQVESIKETYRQKEQDIQSHPPHSPNMLGASAFAAFNFSFEEIETAIDNTAKKYLDEFGAFPLKAQLIGLNNFLGFTVSLKVWRD